VQFLATLGPDVITEGGGYRAGRLMLHDRVFIGGFLVLLAIMVLFNVGYYKSEGNMKRFICWLRGCKTGHAYIGAEISSAGPCARCANTDPAKHCYPLI
jgi:hypothetical protein